MPNFDERSGIVACRTSWGQWWQTVNEIFVEINVPDKTRGKDIHLTIKPKYIECVVHNEDIFKGILFKTVIADESTWTLEGNKILVLLAKADSGASEKVWTTLLEGQFTPDPFVLNEMKKKLDLEQFQTENPGFDFSGASLSKCYE